MAPVAVGHQPSRSSHDFIDFVQDHVADQVTKPAFRRDPAFIRRTLPFLSQINRYFDAAVYGWEHVPADGPMLFVANHSGGILTPDTSALVEAWYRDRGYDSPLVLLAFDFLFGIPGVADALRRFGVVPAAWDNAERALGEGAAVLVYPGGDHEVYRPWTQRNKVDFAGRTGFVKLALRTGVPVVPIVSHGGHQSEIVVMRGDHVADWLHLERLRSSVFPISLLFPIGMAPSWLPHIPLPTKITTQVLEPMIWSEFGTAAADDPEIVQALYREITSRMQATLTELAARHRLPLVERLMPDHDPTRSQDARHRITPTVDGSARAREAVAG